MENIEIPENFQSIVRDFVNDLSATFPEYAYLWEKWGNVDLSESELKVLVYHVSQVFPERFFDILYQNEDIFKNEDSEKPRVDFLPNVDFSLLFNSEGVSETTKNAIWKYLQLILVNILGSIKSKGDFGSTANLFEGVDEKALQEKLAETMDSVSDFFHQLSGNDNSENNNGDDNGENGENCENESKSMPNANDLHEHLNGLFHGKIGSLAKELAEEISEDMQHMFEDTNGESDVRTTQDLLKKMLKNPKKIMDIIKNIGSKLNDKMKSGEINEEEIMKEATDILGKMKGMGGKKEMAQFTDLFKTIGKTMGMNTKNMKMDMGAVNKMQSKFMTKDRMMQKLEQRRLAKAQAQQQQTTQNSLPYKSSQSAPQPVKYSIKSVSQTPAKKNMVFSLEGEEKQEQTIEPSLIEETEEDLDALAEMIESIGGNSSVKMSVGGNVSQKKKKKNKK